MIFGLICYKYISYLTKAIVLKMVEQALLTMTNVMYNPFKVQVIFYTRGKLYIHD